VAVATIVGVVLFGVVFGTIIASGGGGKKTNVATSPSTAPPDSSATTEPPAGSAAGKPCVAVADTPPPGAPAVPVKGAPPPTTLVKEDLKVGTGATVAATDTVTVNYIGVSFST